LDTINAARALTGSAVLSIEVSKRVEDIAKVDGAITIGIAITDDDTWATNATDTQTDRGVATKDAKSGNINIEATQTGGIFNTCAEEATCGRRRRECSTTRICICKSAIAEIDVTSVMVKNGLE